MANPSKEQVVAAFKIVLNQIFGHCSGLKPVADDEIRELVRKEASAEAKLGAATALVVLRATERAFAAKFRRCPTCCWHQPHAPHVGRLYASDGQGETVPDALEPVPF